MVSKILVPTDFSPLADQAVRYASALCKHTNSKTQIVLLHVLPINNIDLQIPATYTPEMMSDQRNYANSQLADIKAILQDRDGLEAETITTLGVVSAEISRIAAENNVELVLMSTHGLSNFLDRIFGTTTSATIQSIQKPLLIIPKDTDFRPIRNIAIATDYSGSEISFLSFVHRLTNNQPVHFHFLHVNEPNLSPEKIINENDLGHYSHNISFHEVTGDEVVKAVKTFVESHDIDMLLVTHHERSFLSELFHTSIAKELSHIVNVPMLVFQDTIVE